MHFSGAWRAVIGLLCFAPVVLTTGVIAKALLQVSTPEGIFAAADGATVFHQGPITLAFVIGLLMFFFCLFCISESKKMPTGTKLLWAVYLFVATPLALPSFWFHHLIRTGGEP